MDKSFKFNYDNSIVSLSNSFLKYYNVPTFHPSLPILDERVSKNYKNVIFMILDGMGIDLIKQNLPHDSFICEHIVDQIFSVFPPTTAAATTAFHSGLTPYESGWLGWMSYYKQYNEIIENFRNTAFYSGKKLTTPPPANDIIKYETIYEKIIKQNPEVEYHKIFPAFEPNGVESFERMCERIEVLSKQNDNRKFFSAYWTEPDSSVHKYGTTAPEVKKIMLNLDENLKKLAEHLKDSLLVISADHGQIDVEEIYLNIAYPELCEMFVRPPALEARFVTFFIKSNKREEFEKKFNNRFSEDFILWNKANFLKSGILGNGKMHKQVPEFIGDYVAISYGNRSLRYSTGEKEHAPLKADHAGMSEPEMLVPLILVEKN